MAWLRDNPDSPSLISLKQSITFPPDRKAKTSPIRNWTPSDKNHRNLDCGDLWARSHTHTHTHTHTTVIYTHHLGNEPQEIGSSHCLWKNWGTGENWEFVGGGRLIFLIIVFPPQILCIYFWLRWVFVAVWWAGATLQLQWAGSCCGGISYCGARVPGHRFNSCGAQA